MGRGETQDGDRGTLNPHRRLKKFSPKSHYDNQNHNKPKNQKRKKQKKKKKKKKEKKPPPQNTKEKNTRREKRLSGDVGVPMVFFGVRLRYCIHDVRQAGGGAPESFAKEKEERRKTYRTYKKLIKLREDGS